MWISNDNECNAFTLKMTAICLLIKTFHMISILIQLKQRSLDILKWSLSLKGWVTWNNIQPISIQTINSIRDSSAHTKQRQSNFSQHELLRVSYFCYFNSKTDGWIKKMPANCGKQIRIVLKIAASQSKLNRPLFSNKMQIFLQFATRHFWFVMSFIYVSLWLFTLFAFYPDWKRGDGFDSTFTI